VDLPVSGSLKIALRRAAEEADGLGHQNIEVKHLLLGLLDGDGTVASMLLRKHGIGRESVLREIQENPLEATNDPELLRAIGIGARNRG
jgi:ATP-dependent Clp protease ATP-binding subunit ClpA